MLRERNILLKRIYIGLDTAIIAGSYISAHYLRQNIHLFYTLDLFPSRKVLDSLSPLDRYLWLLKTSKISK